MRIRFVSGNDVRAAQPAKADFPISTTVTSGVKVTSSSCRHPSNADVPGSGTSALRVACYAYIGLDTKEIAQVMNVRPESVKQARWRLRKALSLPPEVDLRDALGEFDR